jgi:hypothetical protein
MSALSVAQIKQLAYNAGFRGDALNTAVAIALAESSGNPQAYNPELAAGTKTGSGSRGLWQIYGTAHPWANGSQAFDPVFNAQAAYKVYAEAGNRFTPWSTYNNGSYRSYLTPVYGTGVNVGVTTPAPSLISSKTPQQKSVQTVMQTASLGATAEGNAAGGILPQITINPLQGILNPADKTLPKLSDIGLGALGVALLAVGFVLLVIAEYKTLNSGSTGDAIKLVKMYAGGK